MTDNRLNDYRRYSREAEEQAGKAIREQDRASWLRIAQAWLSMIPRRMTYAEAVESTDGTEAKSPPK